LHARKNGWGRKERGKREGRKSVERERERERDEEMVMG
jgi:hypothetical protein